MKDRIAQSFLAHRHFCVYDETRWDLLRKLLSSRLADRLHVICFTSEVLENKQCKQIELAPEELRPDLPSAQRAAFRAVHYDMHGFAKGYTRPRIYRCHIEGSSITRPNAALIRRALLDLQESAPNALVEFQFDKPIELPAADSDSDCSGPGLFLEDTVRQDVIFAAVTTGLRLDRLMLDESFTDLFAQLGNYFKDELVACLSSTRFFRYHQPEWDLDEWQSKGGDFNAIREALQSLSGQQLQTLWLIDVRPDFYGGRRISTNTLAPAQLLRTNFLFSLKSCSIVQNFYILLLTITTANGLTDIASAHSFDPRQYYLQEIPEIPRPPLQNHSPKYANTAIAKSIQHFASSSHDQPLY